MIRRSTPVLLTPPRSESPALWDSIQLLGYNLDVLDMYADRIAEDPGNEIQRNYQAKHVAWVAREGPALARQIAGHRLGPSQIATLIERYVSTPTTWSRRDPATRALRMALVIANPDRFGELL